MTRHLRPGPVLAAALGAVLFTLLSAAPALAHVEIDPESVAPNTFGTFTFQVPNEKKSEDTVGLDVSLPAGFLLESAESVPGWTARVDVRPDGTPVAIHWKGGRLAPHTFGQFSITGKVSRTPGPLSFSTVQHYETSAVSWDGSEESEHPAPTLVVSRSATNAQGGTDSVPQVSVASPPAPTTQDGTDDLARSRADLALMLALAAVLALLGLGALGLLRRRAPADEPSPKSGPRR